MKSCYAIDPDHNINWFSLHVHQIELRREGCKSFKNATQRAPVRPNKGGFIFPTWKTRREDRGWNDGRGGE